MNPNYRFAWIQKAFLITATFGVLLLTVFTLSVHAKRPSGPPPEAFSACEGKTVGDAAEFVSPHGRTVTGTCEQIGDQLVLRPDHHRTNGTGPNQGPPPEAYSACEGKAAGDAAEFVNPHGETVTGTCEQNGDRLVLRPDHQPLRQ